MELTIVGKRRTREITGPTPHSVAIIGKPSLRIPREHLILKRRELDQIRDEAAKIVDYNKQFDLKNTWEQMTSKRIQANTVKRRTENILQQYTYTLEERRDRLKDLLEVEEEKYMSEISAKQETTLERQAKMRERAKYLRDTRESERVALAEKKLEQRWRDQCEEMRSLLVKRNQDEVFQDRAEQIRQKAEEQKRQLEVEAIYARMWEEDRLTKCKREETEAAMQVERNREALKVLTLQRAANEKQKEEMDWLREQEAELLREEAALRAFEDQRNKEEKRFNQERTRAELDQSLRKKMKRKAREMQEELAMDMKLLQEVLQKTSNEDFERHQRKNELRDEMKIYLNFLAEQREKEKELERELDEMVSNEVEKQVKQRLAKWRKEKEARKRLLEDVMETRKRQIKYKMDCIAEEKQRMEKEAEELSANVAHHQQLVDEENKRMHKSKLLYQTHLREQMDFKERLREREREEEIRGILLAKDAERVHQQRVEYAMTNPDLTKTHPKRVALTSRRD